MKPRSNLLTLIAWALLAASTVASAAKKALPADPAPVNRCRDLLTLDASELVSIRPDFKHNTSYTHEVDTTPIKDQCKSESCWVYSRLADLERKILDKTERKISLSEPYVIVRSLQMKALYALDHSGSSVKLSGEPTTADRVIRKYGLMPSKAWKPRIDFTQGSHLSRLTYYLNSRIAQFREESKKANQEQKAQLAKEAKKDLLDLIEAYSGLLPQEFTYREKTYTPLTWAKKFLPKEADRPLDQVAGDLGAEKHTRSERPVEELEQKIISALKMGQTPIITFDVARIFIDHETGIMSLNAFYVPENFKNSSWTYRSKNGISFSRHLTLVVGADVDPSTGRLIKLKIKNSWGTQSGDDGYYHMYRDYFEQVLTAVYLRR